MLDPDSFYQNGHELMKKNWLHPHSWWKTRVLLQSQMTSLSLRRHSAFVLISYTHHTHITGTPFWRGVIKGSIQRAPVWVLRETRETRTGQVQKILDLWVTIGHILTTRVFTCHWKKFNWPQINTTNPRDLIHPSIDSHGKTLLRSYLSKWHTHKLE